eukprot:4532372-Alexandrium_andersonii.AAC.1
MSARPAWGDNRKPLTWPNPARGKRGAVEATRQPRRNVSAPHRGRAITTRQRDALTAAALRPRKG